MELGASRAVRDAVRRDPEGASLGKPPFRSRRRAVGVRPNALTMRGYDELHLLPMTSGRKSLFLQRLQLIE